MNSKNYKLSICIPTYNRADCLPTALDSILEQISDRVEIAICDNGSIDDTRSIVESYLAKHPNIQYFRYEKNVGPDRCFLKSVEIANGEYFWFLGDDDAIEKGSLQVVLDTLDLYPDLSGLSVNLKTYDKTLQVEMPYKPIAPHLTSDRFYQDIGLCMNDLFIYLAYLSGQVCRKDRWVKAIQATSNIEQYFNAYVILFLVAKTILMSPNWMYLHSAYVKYRSHNDSFSKELGPYRRFLLDVEGYETIARGLFGRWNFLYRSCLNKILKHHIHCHLIRCRNDNIKSFRWNAILALFPHYWTFSNFWMKNLPILLIPKFLYVSTRFVYQIIKYKIRRKARISV